MGRSYLSVCMSIIKWVDDYFLCMYACLSVCRFLSLEMHMWVCVSGLTLFFSLLFSWNNPSIILIPVSIVICINVFHQLCSCLSKRSRSWNKWTNKLWWLEVKHEDEGKNLWTYKGSSSNHVNKYKLQKLTKPKIIKCQQIKVRQGTSIIKCWIGQLDVHIKKKNQPLNDTE